MTRVPAEAPTGTDTLECSRCSHRLHPDWNFCPACALPIGVDDEVLSSQIRVLRTTSPASDDGMMASTLLRAGGAGVVTLLVLALAATGLALWYPELLPAVLAEGDEARSRAGTAGARPGPGVGMALEMVPVPEGWFRYGPPREGRNWTSEEGTIPAFEIARHEVSNEQWHQYLVERHEDLVARDRWEASLPTTWTWGPGLDAHGEPVAVVGEPPIPTDWPANWPPGLPVRGVTFDQAQDFCRWLDVSGRLPGARLPREDEWEKAARGQRGSIYPWGDVFLVPLRAQGSDLVPGAVVNTVEPIPVATPYPDESPYGVMHLGGNVAEWTDHWISRPGDPYDERYRVVRGASFQDGVEIGALSAQTWKDDLTFERSVSVLYVGFRVARDAPAPRAPTADPAPTEDE